MEFDVQTAIKIAAYAGGGIAMGFGAIGAAIGEGYTAAKANLAVSRNPAISGDIFKNMLVGQAVAESSSIFALVIAILLLFMNVPNPTHLKAAAFLGAAFSMGFGAIGSGIGSGYPGAEACFGIAQQPKSSSQLTTNMLIGSAVCQTPAIFSMVVALMLIFMDFGNAPLTPTWAAFVGAGLSMGLAAIGSGYGGGLAAGASCEGIARTPQSVSSVTTVMLVGQAVAQTPSIFGLLVSFILMFKSFPESTQLATPMALLSAGFCMGFGGIGPGIGNGMAAEGAVRWVARNVEQSSALMRVMLVGQAVSQSTAIYAMVISLVLIFVV
jgi:F-type H+-transporting ATPase subunit c